MLNREFRGIQAWVDSADNRLRVRTDRRGTDASLAAVEVAANDFGAAAELGLVDDGEVNGGGNVADIAFLNFNTTGANVTATNGDFQLVGNDMYVFSGNAGRNMSDIGAGGASNQITEGE